MVGSSKGQSSSFFPNLSGNSVVWCYKDLCLSVVCMQESWH